MEPGQRVVGEKLPRPAKALAKEKAAAKPATKTTPYKPTYTPAKSK